MSDGFEDGFVEAQSPLIVSPPQAPSFIIRFLDTSVPTWFILGALEGGDANKCEAERGRSIGQSEERPSLDSMATLAKESNI